MGTLGSLRASTRFATPVYDPKRMGNESCKNVYITSAIYRVNFKTVQALDDFKKRRREYFTVRLSSMFKREFIASFEDFQAFSTCPDKSRIKMKTCIEHWWNDAERGKTEIFRAKLIPLQFCTPKISHELAHNATRTFVMKTQRIITCIME